MAPKLVAVTFPLGEPNWGVLKALKSSARNCRFTRSPMGCVRLMFRSKVLRPGMRSLGWVRESLPIE